MRLSTLLLLALVPLQANAFAPATHRVNNAIAQQRPSSSTALDMGPPTPNIVLQETYGEGSRKYRRTVYTHNEWVKHRSSDRFIRNLSSMISSGVYKVLATAGIATFLVIWNGLTGGYTDLDGVQHEAIVKFLPMLTLPLTPFTLLSPSLGLLLVFRTNSSYGRWDEARKFWGLNINHTRDLNRMATAWYGHDGIPVDPARRAEDLRQVSLFTWAFVRSMKRHLSPPEEDESAFSLELRARLSPSQAEAIIVSQHRPNRALFDLSVAIDRLPMHFMRKNEINKNLSIFEDTLGGCERLLSSPVPLFYTRHTARFLSTWLLLLPFALYDPFKGSWNHVAEIPAIALASVFLFGIEELATQLEEPFTILPMQGFCDRSVPTATRSLAGGDKDSTIKRRSCRRI
jgi:putative membrane protein